MKKANLIKAYTATDRNTKQNTVVIVFRDEEGKKHRKVIPRALSSYYILKDQNDPSAWEHPSFISMDKVEHKEVYSDMMFQAMGKDVKLGQYVQSNNINQQPRKNMNIHKHPFIYSSDMDLTDYYIALFNEQHESIKGQKLKKAYFDIEVDGVNLPGFPAPSEAAVPVNAISYFDGETLTFTVQLLRHCAKENPLIDKFEKDMDRFRDDLIKKMEVEDDCKVLGMDIKMYDDELTMIEEFFQHVNKENPDYLLAWNMSFDIQYLLTRIEKLVGKKSAYMTKINTACDPNYLWYTDEDGSQKQVPPKLYFKDFPLQKTEDRWDYFDISSGTNWIDQMLLYGNVRKGQGAVDSYALNAIAADELGKEKLEFGPGETIKNVPYKNYERFVEYNIRDVLLLHLLEEKVLDVDMVHTLAGITNTRINKVMKKTISIKNFVAKFAKERNLVMRNNVNVEYSGTAEWNEMINSNKQQYTFNDNNYSKYKKAFKKRDNGGGYVADPMLNSNVGVEVVEGLKSRNIFENVCDQDLASLYPSIIISYNLDPATQVGKFFLIDEHIKYKIMNEKDYGDLVAVDIEGEDNDTDMTPHLVDSFMSHDWNAIGDKYFDLPETTEMIEEIQKML